MNQVILILKFHVMVIFSLIKGENLIVKTSGDSDILELSSMHIEGFYSPARDITLSYYVTEAIYLLIGGFIFMPT